VATCFLGYEAIRRVQLLRPLFGLERVQNAAGERTARRTALAAQRFGVELSVPQDIN
jgi:hypothetical protein